MGWDGLDGWDLCAGLFYEHRFAMLIIEGVEIIIVLPLLMNPAKDTPARQETA